MCVGEVAVHRAKRPHAREVLFDALSLLPIGGEKNLEGMGGATVYGAKSLHTREFEKLCVSFIVYSFKIFTLRNFMFHFVIILVILLLLKMKLEFPPTPINVLLTGLCLIPIFFYKLFRVGNNLLRQLFGG